MQEFVDEISTRNNFAESFAKGLQVLRAFDATHRRLTMSEVAERSGQTRASARRFLLTLCNLGYLEQDERHFLLRSKVMELGQGYLAGLDLAEIASPRMRALADRLGETSSLGVLEDDKVRIIAYARAARPMSLWLNIGETLPAFCSAQGRVLLAELSMAERARVIANAPRVALTPNSRMGEQDILTALDETSAKGHAIIDEEVECGVRSIAMPVRAPGGRAVAAISVCAHANRASRKEIETHFRDALSSMVQEIETEMRLSSRGRGEF